MKRHPARWLLGATLLLQLLLLVGAGAARGFWINGFDGCGYYAWVRSITLDRDLDFGNEFEMFNRDAPDKGRVFSVSGRTWNQFSAGFPLSCSAGFLVGHGLDSLREGRRDGYGTFAQLGYVTNGFAWYALGLLLLYRLLARRTHWKGALAATLFTAWSATPGYYAWSEPFYAHAVEFATVVCFLYWCFTGSHERPRSAIIGGLLLAWCMWVRLDNALVALVALPFWWQANETRTRQITIFLISLLVGLLPHLILEYQLTGVWTLQGGYIEGHVVHGHGFANLLSPALAHVLLATNNGLLFWCPLAIFSLPCLWALGKQVNWALPVVVIVKLYLVSSWGAWDGSAAMGPRTLTGIIPLLALAIAWDLQRQPVLLKRALVLTGLSSLWFTGLVYQRFSNQLPYYDSRVKISDYPYLDVTTRQFTNVKDLITDPRSTLSRLKNH